MGKQQATITLSFKTDSGKAIKDAEKYLALLKEIQRNTPGAKHLPWMTYYPTKGQLTPQEYRRAVDAGRLPKSGKMWNKYQRMDRERRLNEFFKQLDSGAVSMKDAEIFNPVKLKMYRQRREDFLREQMGFLSGDRLRYLSGLNAKDFADLKRDLGDMKSSRASIAAEYLKKTPVTPQVPRDQLSNKDLGHPAFRVFGAKRGWWFFNKFLGLDAKTTNMFRERYGQGGIANVMWTAWKERVGLTKDYQKTDIFSQAKTWGGLKQAFANVGNMFKRLGSMGMNLIKNMFNGFLGIGKTVFSALGVGALASMAGVVAYLKKAVDYSAQLEQGWVQVKAAAGGNSTAIGNYKAYMDEAALNEGVMPEMYQAMARQYELENRVLNSTEKDKRIRELWAPLARATRMTDGRSASALISGGTGIMKTLNMTSYADEQRIQGMLGALYSNTGLASNPEQWNQFIKGLPRVIGGFKGIISPEEVASVAATLSSFFGEKAGTDVRSVLGMLAGFTKNEGIQNAARFLTGDSKITALGFLRQEQARDPKHGLMNALKRMQDLSIVAEEKGWDEFRFDKMFGYQGGKLTANEILNLAGDQRRVQEDLVNGQQVTRDMIADHKNTYEGKLEEVRSAGEDIKNKIGEAMIKWIEPYLPLIKQKAIGIAGWIEDNGQAITDFLTGMTDNVVKWWKEHGPAVWDGLKILFDGLTGFLEAVGYIGEWCKNHLGRGKGREALEKRKQSKQYESLAYYQQEAYNALKKGDALEYQKNAQGFLTTYALIKDKKLREEFEPYFAQTKGQTFETLSKWVKQKVPTDGNLVFDVSETPEAKAYRKNNPPVDLTKLSSVRLGPPAPPRVVENKNTFHINIEGNADADVITDTIKRSFEVYSDTSKQKNYGTFLIPAM